MSELVAADSWAIVADDLTGATDAGVGFADRGWRVELVLAPELSLPRRSGVVVLSTGARAASPAVAAGETARAVRAAIGRGVTRLFVKIDSVGRGSVAAQIDGALAAWREVHPAARAVVCPAFPAVGRTVVDGEIRVEGTGAVQIAAISDPVTPRATTRITSLIPGSRRASVSARPLPDIAVVDASTDTDLDSIAAEIIANSDALVAVGSGGLASAIARAHRPMGTAVAPMKTPAKAERVLVAVSSLHPVAIAQTRALRQAHDPRAIVVDAPSANGLTPSAAASLFASQVVSQLAADPIGALVLVGGDGAAAVLAQIGAQRIDIVASMETGCPQGVVVGGDADGVRVVTKSGGFGDPETLVRIVDALAAPPIPLAQPAGAAHPQKDRQ